MDTYASLYTRLDARVRLFDITLKSQHELESSRLTCEKQLLDVVTTSSPGSSRFSKWRWLGRRPWHTADHVTKSPTRWICIQNGSYGEKGEKNWVRDVAKVKINKMAGKVEVQFKIKIGKTDTFCM